MIAKGTTHNNGARLAQYMTTGKESERAELWQLSGFAANDIREAFRSVHVMAEATKCEQPFFHVQVRNPEGEVLSRDEWLRVANRIETKLGLTGQPRAIAFHTDLKTGHEHMHLAWSRIDEEILTARPLPFFKQRLKEVSRVLENTLDLTRVRNERDGPVMAPSRHEFEEARRLGVNVHEVRKTIRDCYERSDNGRSFEAALADHGYVLAQGDRRDFIVIDHKGGMHALGKRILGVSAGQARDRLADLSREELPTVEHARSLLRERQPGMERAGQGPMRDADRDEMAWQDALAKAAIEKEKIERRFVEPKPEEEGLGGREKEYGHAAAKLPENVRGAAAHIWTAYHSSHDAREFSAKIEQHNLLLAAVTKEEADRSYREARFAKAIGNRARTYREGEIVAVAEPGLLYRRDEEIVERRRVYQLNKYTTGQSGAEIEEFLAPLDRRQLQGLEATKEKQNARAAERAAAWDALRLENAQRRDGSAPTLGNDGIKAGGLGKAAERVIGKTLDSVSDAIESLFAPTLTPEQQREAAQASRERAAEAADKTDCSRYLAEREQTRRQQEQERDPARQRERDERERA
jgi:hypothetical protein